MRYFVILLSLCFLGLLNSSEGEKILLRGLERDLSLQSRDDDDDHNHGFVMQFFHDRWVKFKQLYKKKYGRKESAKRFMLFVKTVKMIIQTNKEHLGFESEVNKFTDMTDEEKDAETGLNVTNFESDEQVPICRRSDVAELVKRVPTSLDWAQKGKTLAPLEQGKCRSCWAFSTVAVIESRYAIETGILKRFSVQEVLDCSYESKGKDTGCTGGWFGKAFTYVKNTGHLALDTNLPYTSIDGRCTAGRLPNALKSADMVDFKTISYPSFGDMVVALQGGPIAIAIKTATSFYQYGSGIYDNPRCSKKVNHGMVAVGYSEKYLIIKNSWGSDWGQAGYVYYTRLSGNVCGILRTLFYAVMKRNGRVDGDKIEVPDVVQGVCKDDLVELCAQLGFNACSDAMSSNFMKTRCKLTCKLCGTTNNTGPGGCPRGTILCGKQCMHPSFCDKK